MGDIYGFRADVAEVRRGQSGQGDGVCGAFEVCYVDCDVPVEGVQQSYGCIVIDDFGGLAAEVVIGVVRSSLQFAVRVDFGGAAQAGWVSFIAFVWI